MFKRLFQYIIIFLSIEFILRISLYMRAVLTSATDFSVYEIIKIFTIGFWFDLVTCSFILIPIAIVQIFLSYRAKSNNFSELGEISLYKTKKSNALKRFHIAEKILKLIFVFILLFDFVAEHFFWEEFSSRFNFIAVDYLIYTHEVMHNIIESYPIAWILFALFLLTLFIVWLIDVRKPVRNYIALGKRFVAFFVVLMLCPVFYSLASYEQSQFGNNVQAQELSANGIYNLFYAYFHNEVDYEKFYKLQPKDVVRKNIQNHLEQTYSKKVEDPNSILTRIIETNNVEKHKNVIIVVMESMSADYMQAFGNNDNLTPNLDRIANEGLFFTNGYATGTRTVRGLEAIALSIPPTPGQSVLRRPNNKDLFSLGFIFRDRGYVTQFLYGGYGYFDNMNAFFSKNGFDTIDRTTLATEEIQFANVWGVCDEDIFNRAIKEADKAFNDKKPFLQLIMTTSNHRPFTYPDGRIDLKSYISGRAGGVKYSDYSIGQLLKLAQQKPWFNDTVFIFVADHTSGAARKAELDASNYHIPIIFYAPSMISPRKFEPLTSQIDVAPILLGQLDFSYYTKFYGVDLLHNDRQASPIFVSNYQKVAYIKNNKISVLLPKRKVAQYDWPSQVPSINIDQELIEEAQTYYQSASWWNEQFKRIPTVVKN